MSGLTAAHVDGCVATRQAFRHQLNKGEDQKMRTEYVVAIVLVLYVLSCIRTWRKVSRHETTPARPEARKKEAPAAPHTA